MTLCGCSALPAIRCFARWTSPAKKALHGAHRPAQCGSAHTDLMLFARFAFPSSTPHVPVPVFPLSTLFFAHPRSPHVGSSSTDRSFPFPPPHFLPSLFSPQSLPWKYSIESVNQKPFIPSGFCLTLFILVFASSIIPSILDTAPTVNPLFHGTSRTPVRLSAQDDTPLNQTISHTLILYFLFPSTPAIYPPA
ncbi:hypothetical protein B0J18DRAFT_143559 [Chaetomium sp. MPI-SDFR-AT-0129]|nr:hypothetical protein B0J18DRAFT_143559 [Chaetomium sp. MPI-SDFR-AT-0129]